MKSPLVVLSVTALIVFPMSAAFAEKSYTVADAKGRYVFSFQGEAVGGAAVAATGYMVADGKGNIDGVRTINIGGTTFHWQKFYCTLDKVNADGTGEAECPLYDYPANWPLGDETPETFEFVLSKNGDGLSFVGTTEGIVVVGSGARQ
jgi:hypothetical protein